MSNSSLREGCLTVDGSGAKRCGRSAAVDAIVFGNSNSQCLGTTARTIRWVVAIIYHFGSGAVTVTVTRRTTFDGWANVSGALHDTLNKTRRSCCIVRLVSSKGRCAAQARQPTNVAERYHRSITCASSHFVKESIRTRCIRCTEISSCC